MEEGKSVTFSQSLKGDLIKLSHENMQASCELVFAYYIYIYIYI